MEMPCLKTDITFRQPPNPSEVHKGIGTEGEVEEDGQETSGGRREISTFGENVNEETLKNTSIDLLSMYWEEMQSKSQIRKG